MRDPSFIVLVVRGALVHDKEGCRDVQLNDCGSHLKKPKTIKSSAEIPAIQCPRGLDLPEGILPHGLPETKWAPRT